MDVEKELEQIILQKSTVSECLICNIKFNHINTATAHYESKKHKKNTAQFRANALLEAKCRVPLVYQRPDQKTPTTTTSANAQDDVVKIPLERLYTTLRIITRSDPDPPLLFPDTKSKSDSKTSSDLRGQIVNELEKLVQSLYYSNKVPEGVALEYLKKVNEEVKTIIGTHSKPESVNTTNAANGVVPKAKTVNDIGSTNQINETQPQEVKLPSPEKAVNVQVLKQEPKIVASSKQPASPFSKLLNQIVDEKLRLQKAGIQTNATKLKVIDEIEILLLQVSEPNLPIQEILDCLQKFNQIIALDCVKTQSSQPCFEM